MKRSRKRVLAGLAGLAAALAPALPSAAASPDGTVPAARAAEPGQPSSPGGEQKDAAAYAAVDSDERGLWMQADEAERDLRTSPMVIRDPALNAYVKGVLCRITGEAACRNIRLYIMRTPYFNATMAPNGMVQVWSGLLLRTQNEAQLAAVLAHEYTHFQARDTLRLFREIRGKTNAAGFFNLLPFGGIVSLGLVASIFTYSREMERNADKNGLSLMVAAGYDAREAAVIWEHLRAEMDATAEARHRRSRKDRDHGIFETHPPTAERVEYLTEAAKAQPGVPGATGAAAYAEAMAASWPDFIDDQLKMNDFGASEFLIGSMAASGWTPPLLYARAELYRRHGAAGDIEKAVGFYTGGIDGGGTLPELWRGRGLANLKLGQADAARADLQEYLRRAPRASDRAMIAMMTGGT